MRGPPSNSRSVVALAVQFFVNGFVSSYVPRLPEIRDRTGVSLGVLGLVLAGGGLAGLVASFFTGRVVPRVVSRRVMLLGGTAYALALPAIGLAGSAALLVVALVALAVFDVYVDVATTRRASSARVGPPRS